LSVNDRIILDKILEQQKLALAPELTPSKFFEIFTAEQILKDYDLRRRGKNPQVASRGPLSRLHGRYAREDALSAQRVHYRDRKRSCPKLRRSNDRISPAMK
jgi:hypothetical protein